MELSPLALPVLSPAQEHARALSNIEASRIGPRLWQGSAPPKGSALAQNGFHVLVLAAKEYQPPESAFPGVQVLHVPLNDDEREHPLLSNEWARAQAASTILADHHRRGRRILITCMQGRNRSGLITALTLHQLTGMSGTAAIHHVRQHRPTTPFPPLTNTSFVQALAKIAGRPTVVRGHR